MLMATISNTWWAEAYYRIVYYLYNHIDTVTLCIFFIFFKYNHIKNSAFSIFDIRSSLKNQNF